MLLFSIWTNLVWTFGNMLAVDYFLKPVVESMSFTTMAIEATLGD